MRSGGQILTLIKFSTFSKAVTMTSRPWPREVNQLGTKSPLWVSNLKKNLQCFFTFRAYTINNGVSAKRQKALEIVFKFDTHSRRHVCGCRTAVSCNMEPLYTQNFDTVISVDYQLTNSVLIYLLLRRPWRMAITSSYSSCVDTIMHCCVMPVQNLVSVFIWAESSE